MTKIWTNKLIITLNESKIKLAITCEVALNELVIPFIFDFMSLHLGLVARINVSGWMKMEFELKCRGANWI